MAGVMVVYGPPITHLPPPAVGTSPDAAIHDFKGSCRRSVRITVGRSLPCGTFSAHFVRDCISLHSTLTSPPSLLLSARPVRLLSTSKESSGAPLTTYFALSARRTGT